MEGDTELGPDFGPGTGGLGLGDRLHRQAGGNLLQITHDHTLAGSDAFVDYPLGLIPAAHDDRAPLDLILRIHDVDKMIVHRFDHRLLRDEDGVRLFAQFHLYAHEHARQQDLFRVGKDSARCEGARFLVDDDAAEIQGARRRIRTIVGKLDGDGHQVR